MEVLSLEEYVNPIIAEIRDFRAWRAEQRAKYGMDWEDHHPSGYPEYYRSRGRLPCGAKAPE
jgi:hypothetical protein